jgi:hydroxyacylglutathione hydrolase
MDVTIAIIPILSDNYSWLLHDGQNGAVVDPGDAEPVVRLLYREKIKLTHILLTHHHADHCAGADELLRRYGCNVIGPDDFRIPCVRDKVYDADNRIILLEKMDVISTPGHTKTHLVYHFPRLRALFTGDTLFGAGCGRMLEGVAADMLQSLSKCSCLENGTSLYCGHEYTLENLLFATLVEPENKETRLRLADAKYRQRRSIPTVPSTLALEKATNPFLRSGSSVIRKKLGMEKSTDVEVFAELRKRKDKF